MPEQNIWVIDDDPSIRWVLEKALKQAGMYVSSFETADAALDSLNDSKPDTIITDIRMPGMDGLEFLKLLSEQHPDIPVIIMTAHSDLDSAVSAYQGGAFEYLPKPFDLEELLLRVGVLIGPDAEETEIVEATLGNCSVNFKTFE